MTLEGAAERAGRRWRGLTPAHQAATAIGAVATVAAAVTLVAVFDLEGPLLVLGVFLWAMARKGKGSADAARDEGERRRALVAKYGHVPLTDLAASRAPFAETAPRTVPPPTPSPAELARARREALVARHGHMPLTDLADPTYAPEPPSVWEPLGADPANVEAALDPFPAAAQSSAPATPPLPTPIHPDWKAQLRPASSSRAAGGKPIVESARRSWGRRPSRPGSIVE
jgi:hypothetical protein